ncbi:MAG: metallophosphoesterase [Pirellulales bacterium]|nr:metallophosphoesterase [Pirellulales bacterium]
MTDACFWLAAALAALGHGFLWSGLVNRLHGWAGPRRVIKSVTLLCVVAFVAIPLAIIGPGWPHYWPAASLLALASPAGVYLTFCAAIGAASLVVKPWVEHQRHDRSVLTSWPANFHDVAAEVGRKPLTGAMAKFLGNLPGNEALILSIDRKRLVVPRLPAQLAGLTIAHLSDLHMTGGVDLEFYEYLVRRVNECGPDAVAITGDIVEEEACWSWLQRTLGRLQAPLGAYFILGNHDTLIDADRTRALLCEAGLICLSEQPVQATWQGAAVTLIGNEMPWMRPSRPIKLPARTLGREFRLALCHTPDQLANCVQADADLALAGHTHGGQVQLPILGSIMSPSLHGTRYACGVFRRGQTVLHVSRGLGGETPLRWRCPPEAALLELAPAGRQA